MSINCSNFQLEVNIKENHYGCCDVLDLGARLSSMTCNMFCDISDICLLLDNKFKVYMNLMQLDSHLIRLLIFLLFSPSLQSNNA